MKFKKLFLSVFLFIIFFNSLAENIGNKDYQQSSRENVTLDLIDKKMEYIYSGINLLEMYETIDSLQNAQFSNDENIKNKAAQGLFRISNSKEFPEDLRRNSLIAAIATTVPHSDSLYMLEYGFQENLIRGDKYYGMLSVYFKDGDDDLKNQIIDEVLTSESEYGKHIFLVYNKHPEIIGKLSKKVIKNLDSYIYKTIPNFTSSREILNFVDYNAIISWVDLYRNIEYAKGNKNADLTVLKYILNENIDLRYTVAVVYSPLFDKTILNSLSHKKTQSIIKDRIQKARENSKKMDTYEIDNFLHKAIEKLNM